MVVQTFWNPNWHDDLFRRCYWRRRRWRCPDGCFSWLRNLSWWVRCNCFYSIACRSWRRPLGRDRFREEFCSPRGTSRWLSCFTARSCGRRRLSWERCPNRRMRCWSRLMRRCRRQHQFRIRLNWRSFRWRLRRIETWRLWSRGRCGRHNNRRQWSPRTCRRNSRRWSRRRESRRGRRLSSHGRCRRSWRRRRSTHQSHRGRHFRRWNRWNSRRSNRRQI